MMFLIWLLIIIVILYFAFKNKGVWNKEDQKNDESLDLLKQKYINGEIDEDKYKKMLEVLRS
ncbi:MAG: hypothetical protein AB7D16_05610 [Eubacteriaceae bacterium]|nr:hypothetical protein [Eubacteriaceae bacterium]